MRHSIGLLLTPVMCYPWPPVVHLRLIVFLKGFSVVSWEGHLQAAQWRFQCLLERASSHSLYFPKLHPEPSFLGQWPGPQMSTAVPAQALDAFIHGKGGCSGSPQAVVYLDSTTLALESPTVTST